MRALILKIIDGRDLYINGDFTEISNNEIFDRINKKTKKPNMLLLNSVDYFEYRVYERKKCVSGWRLHSTIFTVPQLANR